MFRDYHGKLDWFVIILFGCLGLFLTLMMVFLGSGIYDTFYIKPIADEKANTICKENGFDQYKRFSRVGLFSKNPIGIKCEYAERYTDLGIRSN